MHGATFTFRNAVSMAHKLGEDTHQGATSHVGKAVAAIGGNDIVVVIDGGLHAN